jgi:2-keto-4-pentenoate hydratase/2-oxohepta-3-ene-1,7-dioic acid hydratase in catechol pathway
MRYLARSADGEALLGDDDGVVPLAAAMPGAESVRDVLPLVRGLPSTEEATAAPESPETRTFGSFIEEPGKLFGIGLNYSEHASDLSEESPDEPASFFKPATAATGPGGPIRLPPESVSSRVTAEAELAVVIGRTCRNVSVDEVDDVVAGFVPVIDMTAEDVLQRNPRFLTRAKSFDSFLVLGSRLVIPEPGTDFEDIEVRTVVNDDVVARNDVANMHFSPRELVAFHSEVMTLEPGDVISTGTPGAHPIQPGDTTRAEVDRIGTVAADVVRDD